MTSDLYPFTGHFLVRPAGRLHYLDEGTGEVVVMLHGNPTWSFYYRNVVLALRDRYRCVVPDHLGCGLSDKPRTSLYDYSLKSRIDDLEELLDHLQITSDITLMMHDWGGMIGMGFAARHPGRIKRIIAMNTGCTRLPASKSLPCSLWVARNTALGAWLILNRNAFCKAAARRCVTRKPLPPDVKAMYLMPYDSPEHRIAVLKFVQTIPLTPADAGYDIVTGVEASTPKFSRVPTLLMWGLKDFVFDGQFLAEWQKHFPHAVTHTFPDCGHYLLEDAGEECVRLVTDFLAANPLG